MSKAFKCDLCGEFEEETEESKFSSNMCWPKFEINLKVSRRDGSTFDMCEPCFRKVGNKSFDTFRGFFPPEKTEEEKEAEQWTDTFVDLLNNDNILPEDF